jgi:hypothetical protein
MRLQAVAVYHRPEKKFAEMPTRAV